jgi:arginine decarboxylase
MTAWQAITTTRWCPPKHRAVIADITCDCDGKIDRFIDKEDVAKVLHLHDFKPDEPYYLGVFLVGAYQETLRQTK